jgi:hypothetical protein
MSSGNGGASGMAVLPVIVTVSAWLVVKAHHVIEALADVPDQLELLGELVALHDIAAAEVNDAERLFGTGEGIEARNSRLRRISEGAGIVLREA